MDNMYISNLIITTMKENGFNQAELAQELGISRQTLNYWKNGRAIPSFQTIADIRSKGGWKTVFGLKLSLILFSIA